MSYALLKNGIVSKYPYSKAQLAKDNRQTSFPDVMSDAELEQWGVVRVQSTAEPEYNPKTQTLLWGIPEQIEGVWYHTWRIEDLSPETIQANLQAEREMVSLSPSQFRLALLAINELANIEAAVPQMPKEIQIMWEYATSFDRTNPSLLAMAQQMGFTDVQLDTIFGIETVVHVAPVDPLTIDPEVTP